MSQTLARTLSIYDNFEKLADFIMNQATKEEVLAFGEVILPLAKAINERLNEQ